MEKLKHFLKTTAAGRILLIPYRFWFGAHYVIPTFKQLLHWTFTSREIDNFTYDLTALNRQYLIAFVATVTHQPVGDVQRYIDEIVHDQALHDHIVRFTQQAPERYIADSTAKYSRRIGWYAFVRAMKPKIVVETGTNKGLGSCIIAAALKRNAHDGAPGYLYTTDIDPVAGYLLQLPYSEYAKILYGDSIASLNTLSQTIDLFINDSDHSQEYELREYETVQAKLSPRAIILGDNVHCSSKLWEFSQRTKRAFLFFQEQPLHHWYAGAGIGVSYHL